MAMASASSRALNGESLERDAINVSLPTATVEAARDLGVDVTAACEAGLIAAVKTERERRWREENREAIAGWNRWYEKNGHPLGHLRLF